MQRWNDEQLRAAVAATTCVSQALRQLGLRPVGGNYDTIRRRVSELDLDTSHWRPRRRWNASRDELASAVLVSDSISATLRALGWPVSGGASRGLKRLITAHAIDTSHFRHRRTHLVPGTSIRVPITDYLVKGSDRRITTFELKRRLIAEGIFESRCCGCERWDWLEQPIPLELDHVNGDRTDNRLENLRLLCPNCHTFTSTYRGRNIGRTHYAVAANSG